MPIPTKAEVDDYGARRGSSAPAGTALAEAASRRAGGVIADFDAADERRRGQPPTKKTPLILTRVTAAAVDSEVAAEALQLLAATRPDPALQELQTAVSSLRGALQPWDPAGREAAAEYLARTRTLIERRRQYEDRLTGFRALLPKGAARDEVIEAAGNSVEEEVHGLLIAGGDRAIEGFRRYVDEVGRALRDRVAVTDARVAALWEYLGREASPHRQQPEEIAKDGLLQDRYLASLEEACARRRALGRLAKEWESALGDGRAHQKAAAAAAIEAAGGAAVVARGLREVALLDEARVAVDLDDIRQREAALEAGIAELNGLISKLIGPAEAEPQPGTYADKLADDAAGLEDELDAVRGEIDARRTAAVDDIVARAGEGDIAGMAALESAARAVPRAFGSGLAGALSGAAYLRDGVLGPRLLGIAHRIGSPALRVEWDAR